MMTTVNISLSHDQLHTIDAYTKQFGFTNRSEFLRSILRLLQHKPNILADATTFPFIEPKDRSRHTVIEKLKKTGKYSKEFLDDVSKGLSESDYFIS